MAPINAIRLSSREAKRRGDPSGIQLDCHARPPGLAMTLTLASRSGSLVIVILIVIVISIAIDSDRERRRSPQGHRTITSKITITSTKDAQPLGAPCSWSLQAYELTRIRTHAPCNP